MVGIGLTLSFVLGLFFVLAVSRSLTKLELLGLSFPVGIGLQSVGMVILDLCHINLSANSVITFSLCVILLCIAGLIIKHKIYKDYFIQLAKFSMPKITVLWVILIVILVITEYLNFSKCVFFPTFDRDSVTSFDFLAKVFAHEGSISKNMLFKGTSGFDFSGAASTISYTPLAQCSYAYTYMLGAESSKLINALHYLSFIILFYGFSRRYMTATLSALVTLFCFITPEMISFSSMSIVNTINSYYACAGILFLLHWFLNKNRSWLVLSAIMLSFNIFTRNEGIVFVAAAACVMLFDAIRNRSYKDFLLHFGISISLFVFYMIFLKINKLESESIVQLKLFFDKEKISIIWQHTWALFKAYQYYGIAFITFFLALLSNIPSMLKGKHLYLLVMIIIAWLAYMVVIYQINYVWDKIENVLMYSVKRFLFNFVPLMWFYIGTSPWLASLAKKLDDSIWSEPINIKKNRK